MKMSDYAVASKVEVNTPKPNIGGWLLYFCITFAILGPIKFSQWMKDTSVPYMVVTYGVLAFTSFIAGIATWARLSFALICVRVALLARLFYGILKIYLGTNLTRQTDSVGAKLAQREFISGAINILLVLLLFFYFRVSSRVRETLGKNI
jgi:hypothetical protein